MESPDQKIVEAEEILENLDGYDARKGEIVRLRYFAGLNVEETAEVLGISRATVERELRYIRAWISRERESRKRGDG